MIEYLSDLLKRKEVEFYENVSISGLSSMRLDATCRYLVYPDSANALLDTLALCISMGVKHQVVGRMSNVLPAARFYDGVLIKTDKLQGKSSADNVCRLECGVRFSTAVSFMARKNYGGGEALFHIPASVGGMVYSNAGAYGTEISDLFESAVVFDNATGKMATLGKKEMAFGYRTSILRKRPLTLLSAKLSFVPVAMEHIFAEIHRLGAIRQKSQPLNLPSLGSIFKAHKGVGAGFYIDRAGLKGVRLGGASVSEKHAGFIVNNGSATPEDVIGLIDLIKSRVMSLFGVELDTEVQII